MLPVFVDTHHPMATNLHSVPHLQTHFYRPAVVSELQVVVDGTTYNVYVSHKVGMPTRSTSEVIVVKQSRYREYSIAIWDHDKIDVLVAVNTWVLQLTSPFEHTHMFNQVFWLQPLCFPEDGQCC